MAYENEVYLNLMQRDYIPEEYNLINYKNYYIYGDLIKQNYENGTNIDQVINVETDLDINNIDDHIEGIFNILKDGIETNYVHNAKIELRWSNGAHCRLGICDYWFNLFMWSMILYTKKPIRPKHIFLGSKIKNLQPTTEDQYFPWELRRNDIQRFINKFVLTLDNKINIGNKVLNEIIAEALWKYSYLEHFAYYLANTINNEDDIAMMRAIPEYNQLKHCSLANVPFDKVKEEGMKITYRVIDYIKNSEAYLGYEHGLTNSFRSNEAINPRQYKEACLNIGTKPNGSGSLYPHIIDTNFSMGGVDNPLWYFIESSTARAAQILSKINVGETGEFARILGLNSTDTILNTNPDYMCNSKHFIKYEIKSLKHLYMIKGRYFRYNPNGIDYLIENYEDENMVGKTIYLHSPITCMSHSLKHGICRKCYGTLYWTNLNINPGKFAAEILSSQITQTLLSAKHLLETMIASIKWSDKFNEFFEINDADKIRINDNVLDNDDYKQYTLIIDPNNIQLVNDEEDTTMGSSDDNDMDDDSEFDIEESDDDYSINNMEDESIIYNEYITSFVIKTPSGEEIPITSEDQHELYISNELNNLIRKKGYNVDGRVNISFSDLTDDTLFYIVINNNEISKLMKDIINVINKASVTESLDKDSIVQKMVDLCIEGNLEIDSIHLEVIIANQTVDPDNILNRPKWNEISAKHKVITLNQALTYNPSVIISLLYKDLQKTLYNPLTYSKNAPSFFDLFFCQQPQNYMNDDIALEEKPNIRNYDDKILLYRLTNKPTREKEYFDKIRENMIKSGDLIIDENGNETYPNE